MRIHTSVQSPCGSALVGCFRLYSELTMVCNPPSVHRGAKGQVYVYLLCVNATMGAFADALPQCTKSIALAIFEELLMHSLYEMSSCAGKSRSD